MVYSQTENFCMPEVSPKWFFTFETRYDKCGYLMRISKYD